MGKFTQTQFLYTPLHTVNQNTLFKCNNEIFFVLLPLFEMALTAQHCRIHCAKYINQLLSVPLREVIESPYFDTKAWSTSAWSRGKYSCSTECDSANRWPGITLTLWALPSPYKHKAAWMKNAKALKSTCISHAYPHSIVWKTMCVT